MHSDIPKIIHMIVGREMIIPCRVTAPNIAVTLKKVPQAKHALKVLSCFLFVCLSTTIVVLLKYCNNLVFLKQGFWVSVCFEIFQL